MTIDKIYEFLNEKFPVDKALEYDNPGFLIGDKTADIKSAVLALDCTDSAIDTAIENGANLIITHHPVIFKGIKSIKKDDIVYRLIENGISVISMHTNLDTCKDGVNDALADALELKNVETLIASDGLTYRKGELMGEVNSNDFAAFVGKKLDTAVKYVGEGKVKTVAVCGGSGADLLYECKSNGCDAFITSEVKHHQFLDAEKMGLTIIDAGHFPTEDTVIEPLCALLSEKFSEVNFITDHYSPIKVCINI